MQPAFFSMKFDTSLPNILLQFCDTCVIICVQIEQRLPRCKDKRQALGLQKGMGSKSPHLTNTVGTEK